MVYEGFEKLIGLFLVFTFTLATPKIYEGHQLWRITLQNSEDEQTLKDLGNSKSGVEMMGHPSIAKPALLLVPKHAIRYTERFLLNRNLNFEITAENLEAVIKQQKRRKRALVTSLDDFVYTEYHKYEEIVQWMDLVVGRYSFITKHQIGVTYEGRQMYALQIKKSAATKPVIYIDAMTHAREWVTTASALFLWNEILRKTENQWMLNDIDWYFVPIVNVDGYVYTWTDDRNWRKTRSQTTVRAHPLCDGVDGNRNFDDHWAQASTDEPCSVVYHGPFPHSEPMIRHVTRFISEHKSQIKGVVSLHSFSQLVMYPYGYAINAYTPDREEQHNLAVNITEAMFKVHQTVYTPAQGANGLDYEWSGNTMDWTYGQAGVKLSYTIELRDNGTYGFFLPPDQIVPTGEELLEGLKVYARYVRDAYP